MLSAANQAKFSVIILLHNWLQDKQQQKILCKAQIPIQALDLFT